MNFNYINNKSQLTQVFNKYELDNSTIISNLMIILPSNVDRMLADFLSNVELSLQHKYVGSVNITSYNLFNDIELYNILLKATYYANKIIDNSGLKILSNNSKVWKIFVYTNMMWNLPFTLEDVIFIPFELLDNCRLIKNNNYYSLIKTLIHERIHVMQRHNVDGWVDYIYVQNKNWIKVNKGTPLFTFLNSYDIDKLMEFMIVKNPDTIYSDFKYVYNYKNKLYYGILYLNELRNIDIQWFQINEIINTQFDKNNLEFSLEKSDRFIQSQEHPFEIYAYKLSEELTNVYKNNNKLETDIDI